MADIQDINAAQSVKVIGASSDGTEQTPVQSNAQGEILASDITQTAGLDTVITIAPSAVVELKVGGTAKANRKYVQIEALDTGLKWGFSAGTRSFNARKSQFFILPFGANTSIWLENTSGSNIDVAIGEI